jgi:hypothetical protein
MPLGGGGGTVPETGGGAGAVTPFLGVFSVGAIAATVFGRAEIAPQIPGV